MKIFLNKANNEQTEEFFYLHVILEIHFIESNKLIHPSHKLFLTTQYLCVNCQRKYY